MKSAKLTQEAKEVSERLIRTLSDLGKVHRRKMFGGYGIFESGAMFALITSECKIHFKVDSSNHKRFENTGAAQHGKMPYFEVPANVLHDKQELREWASDSIAVARRAKAKR